MRFLPFACPGSYISPSFLTYGYGPANKEANNESRKFLWCSVADDFTEFMGMGREGQVFGPSKLFSFQILVLLFSLYNYSVPFPR